MSRIVTAILIFHRHKPIDIISFVFEALRALTMTKKKNLPVWNVV
jgi:hypothetical protein